MLENFLGVEHACMQAWLSTSIFFFFGPWNVLMLQTHTKKINERIKKMLHLKNKENTALRGFFFPRNVV